MATLQIKNLPDDLYSQLQRLASQHNATIDDTVIQLLRQAVQPAEITITQDRPMQDILAKIRSRPRVNPIEFGLPDSTLLIREDRNR